MSATETAPSLATQERELKEFREQLLRPTAQKFGYPLGQKNTAAGLPTVLCLGNHSSGKSTFINHLAGQSIQDTGVAPTDDGFTLITYGEKESSRDGRSIVADPNLPYANFEQYGKDFLDHLKLKRLPLEQLKEVCLIDSPGLIDHAGSPDESSRGYDFAAVVREFAETADLVIFFFDPEKPGTTGESLRIFTDALSDVMYKLLIVFNKVDTFNDVRDFARTYGSLCWNLSRVVRTKDMPHIFCTFVPDHVSGSTQTINLTDFEKSTRELKREISRVGDRRRTNMVSALLDTSRQLRVHATLCREVGKRIMLARIAIWLGAILAVCGGGWLLWNYRENNYLFWLGIVSLVGGVGLAAASRLLLKMKLHNQIGKLDALFHDVFSKELLELQNNRFLEGLWKAVKPRTIHFLKTVGPGGIPFSPLWPGKLKKLRQAIENDIPEILAKVSSDK